MSLATVMSRARLGIGAPAVSVEVHLAPGLPALNVVGLPETAVKESKDRVRSALLNSHFDFPARRITVNLAPADLPKEGGRFDLPIALGILAASGQLPGDALADKEFIGELGLSGQLRPVPGALPAAIACGDSGRALIVPAANADEAALARTATVFGAGDLLELCAFLRGRTQLAPATPPLAPIMSAVLDIADVRGQAQAKRALTVAAAGAHNLLFYGPPGTGKTMLASRLPGLLPPLAEREQLEVAAIHSIAGSRDFAFGERPFRAPHHTASAAALVGGGSQPRPGEISLAHHGVLFLDELPEFQRKVLEVMREPLESGEILIARARQQLRFPARFQLIAAMNPCPCGYLGDRDRECRCTPDQIRRYRDRLSGPLLDRIDLQVPVQRLPAGALTDPAPIDSQLDSATLRSRVLAARERQLARQGKPNGSLSGAELDRDAAIPVAERRYVEDAVQRLHLSARAYHRLLKVARTLADLAAAPSVERDHVGEALQYRNLDRSVT